MSKKKFEKIGRCKDVKFSPSDRMLKANLFACDSIYYFLFIKRSLFVI